MAPDGAILPNITIVNEEPRAITGLRVTADFTINGQPYTDYEDIGNFDRHYILELNGMNGSWNGTKWVGNFLSTKGSGFDTTNRPGPPEVPQYPGNNLHGAQRCSRCSQCSR